MRSVTQRSLRVVIDTNVLISAIHFPTGRLSGIWERRSAGHYRLVLSPAIVGELAEKLRGKFRWEEGPLRQIIRALVRTAEIVQPAVAVEAVPDDPDDNEIIACALSGKVDMIVSGDRHLLAIGEYKGIPIVRPIDFLRTIGGTQ